MDDYTIVKATDVEDPYAESNVPGEFRSPTTVLYGQQRTAYLNEFLNCCHDRSVFRQHSDLNKFLTCCLPHISPYIKLLWNPLKKGVVLPGTLAFKEPRRKGNRNRQDTQAPDDCKPSMVTDWFAKY